MKSLVASTLIFLSAGLSSAQTANAMLATFFREHLDASFQLRPAHATSLGEHRYDDRLDDLTPTARARWTAQTRAALAALPQRVNRAELTRADQMDYDIFEHDLQKKIWLAENFDFFVTDPRVYSQYISGAVYDLLAQSSLPREVNVANAIARIRQVPTVIAAARMNLQNPPRVCVETAIQQNQGAISFYEKDVVEIAGDTRQLAALKAAAAGILPALKDYQQFLAQELLPRANGEWRIGKEKFARKLELELDADLTADQVHADAQAEFQRVRNDMYVIARQLWSGCYPRAALPPDDAAGRRTTVERVLQHIALDRSTSATIVDDVRDAVEHVKKFLTGSDLVRLPQPDLCRVIEMPGFQRGNSTAYMKSPPPLDTNAVGFYAVSQPPQDWDAPRMQSYFAEYNRSMLRILTIHEAYPGHYVQMEYANRNPSLIRKVLGSGAFIEGWAVYTEQMMLDQGYGEGDLALRLTQLKFYLRAVANAILDHRMHCETLTDEEAMDLLVNQSFQAEGEARLKVIRAKQSAVQLSTYFAGRMGHYRLRQQVERELGDAFDLGRYHAAVLASGSIPLKFLPALVRGQLGLREAPTP
ncbi:MAG: DUF885 domain-containing protein [Verrucomicrobia bacterium]|nr:DUF885 domain-containing protein [Verrucomicrobiota bacterium]